MLFSVTYSRAWHWPLARWPDGDFQPPGQSGHKHAFFHWPDGPLGNRSGHWWVWRTLARRHWWPCLQSPRKQQTVTSVLMGICHHGVAVRGFVWLCLWWRNSLPNQLWFMWLPDTATRLECIVYSAKSKHCSSLVSAFRFQRVSVCKSQYTMHLRDCI